MLDSLIARLTFDASIGVWTTPLPVRMFGRDWILELSLDGEIGDPPGRPTSEQTATLGTLVKHQDHILLSAESGLLAYYTSQAPELRRMLGAATAHRLVPEIERLDDLPKVVTPKTIYICEADPPGTFCLLLDCTWDPSHGVGVRFVGVEVDLVGSQDEML